MCILALHFYMNNTSKNIPFQYQGFLLTPMLWGNKSLYGLKQFFLQSKFTKAPTENIPDNLMLGKRVERFVSNMLVQQKDITILKENIQINHNQLTIGEIDCLLLESNIPKHIEIVYKFYLYDDSVGKTELDHLIGPNRKDSLVEKLEKLSNKQLPLLHNPETQKVLNKLNLTATDFEQYVYFKAQIFLPISQLNITFKNLNSECITGFYTHLSELKIHHQAKFYIPKKTNWLVAPHKQVDWINFEQFKTIIQTHLARQKAPLCWLKKPNGELQKFFVIWW